MTLELHAPKCPARNQKPCDCDAVLDAYALCYSIVNDHIHVGAKRHDGSFTGPSPMSHEDVEELVQELVQVAWLAAERFNGGGRLNGYVAYKLNFAVTDWKRKWFGSTRYGHRPVVELTDDERLHVADLVDLTGPEVLGLVNCAELAPDHRRTYRTVVLPMVVHGLSLEECADRSRKPVSQVRREVGSLRREIERIGLLAA